MNKNEFELLNYIRKHGLKTYREMSNSLNISLGNISIMVNNFVTNEFINKTVITQKGLKQLLPYKVNNAVILAAGPSSRFVPLSLEMPKGLFKVRDEVLIERQIKQLKEAGVNNITLVLGYKKELFFYLIEKYNVNIVINSEYNKKNNIESIYLAKDYISNTYICSCDDYFTKNPFEEYEYTTFYASVYSPTMTKEAYVKTNSKNEILEIEKGKEFGDILLGHSFWNKEFSYKFIQLMEKYHESGEYDNNFWEKLLSDNIKLLPPMCIKRYPSDTIFEFDFVSELRAFDNKYINNTESKIMANICLAFKCNENEIAGFKPIHEGMTNTSFIFSLGGEKYVYRQPGDGTDAIINRKHEKIVLETAKKYGFDSTYLYMNETEGWKISKFVPKFREPDYSSFEDSLKVIEVLKKLHSLNPKEIDWIFDPIVEADKTEKLIRQKSSIDMNDFDDLKNKIHKIYSHTINDGVEKCFCHSDTYKPNWMITDNETILIDWEYSGKSDPGIDVGYYIVDAMYEFNEADKFIKAYCGEKYNNTLKYHYFAYTAIIAYYWFVWALYREACGAVMGESLFNWYKMAKKYSEYIIENMLIDIHEKCLSRAEFELLKHLKTNGNKCRLDARYFSNMLLFSEETIKNTIDSCHNKKYINLIENEIILTLKGEKYLDAYKTKKAIIMAAGFGSRMVPITLERPKPMVIVNGKRIIDTLIDSLLEHDITEIYIIRGYKKEIFDELLEKYPNINFIDNDEYNTTNNISSIIKAIDKLENCYICEADFLISNSNIISNYHYQSNYLGARVIETDDWCFRSKDNYAYDYKKGNSNCYQAYGISFWTNEDCINLKKDLQNLYKTENGKQQFWESVVFDFNKDHYKIEINNCSKCDIVEIDNFYELVEIDKSYEKYNK